MRKPGVYICLAAKTYSRRRENLAGQTRTVLGFPAALPLADDSGGGTHCEDAEPCKRWSVVARRYFCWLEEGIEEEAEREEETGYTRASMQQAVFSRARARLRDSQSLARGGRGGSKKGAAAAAAFGEDVECLFFTSGRCERICAGGGEEEDETGHGCGLLYTTGAGPNQNRVAAGSQPLLAAVSAFS